MLLVQRHFSSKCPISFHTAADQPERLASADLGVRSSAGEGVMYKDPVGLYKQPFNVQGLLWMKTGNISYFLSSGTVKPFVAKSMACRANSLNRSSVV